MANNFILEEVISDLMNDEKSLVSPLMKLQYFAKRIKNDELLNFVLSELNGYKGNDNLPDYRTTSAVIHIDILFGNTPHSNLEIPVEMLREEEREVFRKYYLTESVAVLENMDSTKDSNTDGQYLVFNFPLTLIHLFQEPAAKLYKNPYYSTKVTGGRLLGNSNILPTSLTAIRSRLLSFCMEIGETFGYNIAIDSFNKSQNTNNEKVIHLMSTVINNHGDGSIINTGDKANIQATITISKGNKEQLNEKLKELGIASSDIQELNMIVDEDLPEQNKKLGNKTIDWITKISG
jgi:hypothetical protein